MDHALPLGAMMKVRSKMPGLSAMVMVSPFLTTDVELFKFVNVVVSEPLKQLSNVELTIRYSPLQSPGLSLTFLKSGLLEGMHFLYTAYRVVSWDGLKCDPAE